MSRKPSSLMDGYLLGNAHAFKLLGCCFLSLLEKEYRGSNDFKIWMIQELQTITRKPQRGSKADYYPSDRTWNRWRKTDDLNSPFLSGRWHHTKNVFQWAQEKNLISFGEQRFFGELFNLLFDPLNILKEEDAQEIYARLAHRLMEDFAGFYL